VARPQLSRGGTYAPPPRRLSAAHDPAAPVVTHDVGEAIELADRVILLEADAPLRARFLWLLGVEQALDA